MNPPRYKEYDAIEVRHDYNQASMGLAKGEVYHVVLHAWWRGSWYVVLDGKDVDNYFLEDIFSKSNAPNLVPSSDDPTFHKILFDK